MKQTAIFLILLLLLSGCSTIERPESKAPEPDSFLSEPVTSSSESSIQEEAEVAEPETTETESSVPSTSVDTPAETNAPTEAESISYSAGKNEPQNEPEPVETPQPESSTPEQSQETPELAQSASEPEFDVEVWLNFARRYGGEIGLSYDGTATGCWDTPIEAHAGCVYLERDIRDALDWYKASGFTSFCVWSESLGNGNYNIYIGYA